MDYEFSLNKTSLISLIAGWIVISVLLFGAGLVIGSQWLIGSATEHDTIAQNEKADQPTEPVLIDDKAPPQKSLAAPAKEKSSAPKPPAAAAAATTFAAKPEQTAQAAEAPTSNGEVKIISEAASDQSNGEDAAKEPDYVTVQVGVFLDENDANRLLKQIERKGYAPSFFSGRDAEARQWYAVRIGAYSDKQQAANAAANFTRQEKLKAVVRPVGSL